MIHGPAGGPPAAAVATPTELNLGPVENLTRMVWHRGSRAQAGRLRLLSGATGTGKSRSRSGLGLGLRVDGPSHILPLQKVESRGHRD